LHEKVSEAIKYMDSYLGGLLLFGIGLFLYFIPTWIAWGKKNCDSVIAINLFLGWTFVGWVIALAMSLSNDKPPIVIPPPKQDNKLDKLMKLKNLLDSGALTELEYNKEKEKILNS